MRIDGIDRAGEPALDDVPQDLVPDAAAAFPGTDHGHRRRHEDVPQADLAGCLLPDVHGLHGAVVRGQVHHDELGRALHPQPDVEAEVVQNLYGRTVLGQHLGVELSDPHLARSRRQVLEQQRADALVVVFVGHQQRHLRRQVGDAFEGGHPDELPVDPGAERDVLVARRLHQKLDVRDRRGLAEGEEPQVPRSLRHPGVQFEQRIDVARLDGTDVDETAVGADGVDPAGRVGLDGRLYPGRDGHGGSDPQMSTASTDFSSVAMLLAYSTDAVEIAEVSRCRSLGHLLRQETACRRRLQTATEGHRLGGTGRIGQLAHPPGRGHLLGPRVRPARP